MQAAAPAQSLKPEKDLSKLVWRNTLAIALARIGCVAFDGLAYILTARYFGPSEYGHYLAALAFINLVDVAADMTCFDVSIREMSLKPAAAGGWLGALTILRVSLGLLGMAGFLAYLAATGHLGDNWTASAVAALAIPAGGLRTPIALFRSTMKMHFELIIVLATRLVNLLIVLVLMTTGAGVAPFFMGLLGSRVLLGILAWGSVATQFKVNLATSYAQTKHLLRECLPMGLSGLFVAVQLKVDILLIASMVGATTAGLYGAVAQLPEYSLYMAVIITTPMLPVLSQAFADSASVLFSSLFQKMLDTIVAVVMPLATVSLVLPRPSVVLIFGDQYGAVSHFLPLLVLATIAMWVSHATAIATVAAGLQRHFVWIQSTCMISYVLLDYLLIPYWGATAAAGVRLFTCLLAPVLTYVVIQRNIGIKLGAGAMRRIAVATAVMSAALFVCSALPLVLNALIGGAVYGAVLWALCSRQTRIAEV